MTDKVSLIETLAKKDMFSVFSRLMGTSKANEAFSAGGDFTVFAPTNDAFGKIPDEQMDALLNEKDQIGLKALLSYHILPGKFFAANIASSRSKPTIAGADVKFTDFGGLKVNDSGVLARNIEATNGVIHALDTVLIPKAKNQQAVAAVAPTASAPGSTPKAASEIPTGD